MKLTPLHLMLLLHYFTTPDPWPQAFAPAVVRFTDDLLGLGLIHGPTARSPARMTYDTTEKGNAYIRALCTLPLPVARWVVTAQEERAV